VVPLIGDSLAILMQRQPKELDDLLPACFHKLKQLEGVYSIQEPHFWTLCSEVYIGALKLEVAPNADSKYLQTQAHNIFTAVSRQLGRSIKNQLKIKY
jgi:zinc transporter 5/7